jgi:hypothetical protein
MSGAPKRMLVLVPHFEPMAVSNIDVCRVFDAARHFATLEADLRARAINEFGIDDADRATEEAMHFLLRMVRGMILEEKRLGRGYWLDGADRDNPIRVGGGVVVT